MNIKIGRKVKNGLFDKSRIMKQLIFIGLACLVSACAGRKIGTPPSLGNIAIPVQRGINYSDSSDLTLPEPFPNISELDA